MADQILTQKGKITFITIAVLLIGIAAFIAYKSGHNTGFSTGHLAGYDVGHEEGEIQGFNESFLNTAEKYLKSRKAARTKAKRMKVSSLDLDYRGIAKQLFFATDFANDSSQIYFSEALSSVHKELLGVLVEQTEVEAEVRDQIFATYDSLHPQIAQEHYVTFQNKMELALTTDPIFQKKAYIASQEFSATVSEYVCGMVEKVGIVVAVSTGGLGAIAVVGVKKGAKQIAKQRMKAATVNSVAKGEAKALINQTIVNVINPCTSILNNIEIFNGTFRDAGAYVDMQHLEVNFGNYIRRGIAEIATTEDEFNNIIVKDTIKRFLLEKYTKFFKRDWLASKATIKIKADARVKAGIDIARYFSYTVIPDEKKINILVPTPKVMSREIYSTIVEMEDGTLVDVDKEMLNSAEHDIRMKLERQLKKSNLLEDAKTSFESFFEAIILPSIRYQGISKVSFTYLSEDQISAYQASPEISLKENLD